MRLSVEKRIFCSLFVSILGQIICFEIDIRCHFYWFLLKTTKAKTTEFAWFLHRLENLENGKTFSSQGKSGYFEQTGKVRETLKNTRKEGFLVSFYF